jgi:hypothetical protein
MGFSEEFKLVSIDKTRVKAISLDDAKIIWAYFASQGNMKALALASGTSANMLIYHKKKRKVSIRGQEKIIQKQMWQKLGGKIEVPTLAGKIDLLTPLELIEIKEVNGWKCAIGQVLSYGYYYPSHQKRIHLFGSCQESYIDLVESHCNPLNIIVTLEG